MFIKRLAFVLLIVSVLSCVVDTAVAQSEPQQFVVVYVEFKPANERTGGDVLQQLDAHAEDSAGFIRFDVLQQTDRPNFFALFEVWSDAQTFEDFQNSSETQAILAQLTPTPNHFQLIETFEDLEAFDDHVSAQHTVDFRTATAPFLGAPYDERLYQFVRR